eukprot:EG_transcript_4883
MLDGPPPHFEAPPHPFCSTPRHDVRPPTPAALAALHRAAHLVARRGFGAPGEPHSIRAIKAAGCVWLWALLLVAVVYVTLSYALGMGGLAVAVVPLQAYLFLFPVTALGWYYLRQSLPLHLLLLGSVLWMACVDWLSALTATHFLGLPLLVLAVVDTSTPRTVPHLFVLLMLRDLELIIFRLSDVSALLWLAKRNCFTIDVVILALNFGIALTMAALLLCHPQPSPPGCWWPSPARDLEARPGALGGPDGGSPATAGSDRLLRLRLQLQNQRKLTHTLISNIFPKDIADELFRLFRDDFDLDGAAKPEIPTDAASTITTPRAQAKALRAMTSLHRFAGRTHKYAAILFADLVGFTVHAAHVTPRELVDFLDVLFSLFDEVAQSLRVEKIKTIGDCYMCAAWIEEHRDCPAEAANATVMLADAMHRIVPQHSLGEARLSLRVGVHGGTVVGGIIGKSKFCYDIWGDTVNLASRMESTGVPNATQVSEEIHGLLKDRYAFEPRSCVTVKGKGALDTYLLHPSLASPLGPPAVAFPRLPSDGVQSIHAASTAPYADFRRRRLPEALQSVCDLLSYGEQTATRSLPGVPRSPPGSSPPSKGPSTPAQLLRLPPALG